MDPFAMRPEQVRIGDIAHSLSMMTRANGHLNRFFSIAQHCLNCAKEARARGLSNRIRLACLLHDAAECYLADVPRPVKRRLSGYAEAEERVTKIVFAAFGIGDLSEDEKKAVGEIDDAMLYFEFFTLAGAKVSEYEPHVAAYPDFSEKTMPEVEREFLKEFETLTT